MCSPDFPHSDLLSHTPFHSSSRVPQTTPSAGEPAEPHPGAPAPAEPHPGARWESNTEPAASAQAPSHPGDLPHGRPLQSTFDDGLDYPRLGSMSFRRGSLTPRQKELWDTRWPELGQILSDELIDVAKWFGHPTTTPAPAPTTAAAPTPAPTTAPASRKTILEIGSGTGTSTVAMAKLETDTDVIAVEMYKAGLAKMLMAMDSQNVTNIRMVRGDGVEVLNRMVAPASLDGVRIFFPDPWPKARHHKRRIIQTGTLHLIATRLKPGGVLHVATDHADYADWIGQLTQVEPLLEYKGWPWPECPIMTDRHVITKFEKRGLDLDNTISEFLWQRREDTHD